MDNIQMTFKHSIHCYILTRYARKFKKNVYCTILLQNN